MNNSKQRKIENDPVKFLIAEYQSLKNSFWEGEKLGEGKVNFFLTFSTAIVTALIIYAKDKLTIGSKPDPILFLGLGIILLIGITSLKRLVVRNLITFSYLRAVNRIRKYFIDTDNNKEHPIKDYLLLPSNHNYPRRVKQWKEIFTLGCGGLVEIVALVNSIVVAAICALSVIYFNIFLIITFTISGLLLAWIIQNIYVMICYKKDTSNNV